MEFHGPPPLSTEEPTGHVAACTWVVLQTVLAVSVTTRQLAEPLEQ